MLVRSSDHLISPHERFLDAVVKAETLAKKGNHVIFGIRPDRPETGYGYIKTGRSIEPQVYEVEKFIEKPSLELAEEYLLEGHYLWNSANLSFPYRDISARNGALLPDHFRKVAQAPLSNAWQNLKKCLDISIDYALMEKSKKTVVIPLDLTWSDVGSWDSVYELLEKDENQNVKIGNVLDIDTQNCLIMGGKHLISTIGLKELLVIETDDALLIGKKGSLSA